MKKRHWNIKPFDDWLLWVAIIAAILILHFSTEAYADFAADIEDGYVLIPQDEEVHDFINRHVTTGTEYRLNNLPRFCFRPPTWDLLIGTGYELEMKIGTSTQIYINRRNKHYFIIYMQSDRGCILDWGNNYEVADE